MGWILLIVFAAAVLLNITGASLKTDKPLGMACLILMVTAAGAYTARVGTDITVNVISRAIAAGAESEYVPSLTGCLVRGLLWIPLMIGTAVLIFRNQFIEKDYSVEEAAKRRQTLSVVSTVLMCTALIAGAAVLIIHADVLIAAGIAVGIALFVVLILTLICPFCVFLFLVVGGVGIVVFLKILALPIMLYFAASALYLLTVICAIGVNVSAMNLTYIKKRWYILLILLSFIPIANNFVYILIPDIMKKHSAIPEV